MLRTTDHCTEFKNNNINVRFDHDDIASINSRRVSDIEVFSWCIDEIDCTIVGDEWCAGNAIGMACTIYNYYSDMCYDFYFSDIDRLLAGKTVKLYAHKPTEYEREQIQGYDAA